MIANTLNKQQNTEQYLNMIRTLLSETLQLSNDFLSESQETLSMQPSPTSWSAIQCIDHLNKTYDFYLPKISKEIESGKKRSSIPDQTFRHNGFIRQFIRRLLPDRKGKTRFKVRTFKKILPASGQEKEQVIRDFQEKHKALQLLLNEASKLNLSKIRIVSLAGPLIKFKLGSVFLFLEVHNRRHFLQAKEAIQASKQLENREIDASL